MSLTFTPEEIEYLRSQPLARLATVDAGGAPQNNPVGFKIESSGDVLIAGYNLSSTRKFRNVQANPNVAFVVDDLASVDPWVVRGVEVRGTAQAQVDVDPPITGASREVIRITPRWIGSWGIEPGRSGVQVRRALGG